ncbi:TolC family outer membrane protein [Labrenzia sp. DG1229]|uniref:TolC family outer membrane protein n=1 Tax=Labrenzia sp. DG1229 TaxID=681847 RepID=UPI000A427807
MICRSTIKAATVGLALMGGVAAVSLIGSAVTPARAETIREALALAYTNNPSLNAARAALRGTDEGVPQALSGWRPTVTAGASIGRTWADANSGNLSNVQNNASISLSISQTLFAGFRTVNSVRQAESIVLAQRESLISSEQDTLLSAASAYVGVIRDTALVSLQRSDLEFLQEQVRAARDRFDVGEGTRTDVSQAEARAAEAQASLNSALANLNSSRAVYRQVIGIEARNLSADAGIAKFVPKSLDSALAVSAEEQPLIRQAQHQVDAAIYSVKTAEGAFLPTVSMSGSVSRSVNPGSFFAENQDSVSITGNVSIPIYQAGSASSAVRQSKEALGQTRLQLDVTRDQIRANVISAWGNYQAAEASIIAAQAAVEAQKLALEGVIEEQRVGQRTTLDVLDAQRELVTQQSNLVSAQSNRIVSGYQLVAAVGKLDARGLGLRVKIYEPTQHYEAVRGKWFGLRTPDGR